MGDPKKDSVDKHRSIHTRTAADQKQQQMMTMITDLQKQLRADETKAKLARINQTSVSALRDEVSSAETYFLGTYTSLMGGLSIANQDFTNITKDTTKSITGAILDALLVLTSIVIAAPELAAFTEAINTAKVIARVPQVGAQANKLLDLAKTQAYAAGTIQMEQTRKFAAQLDDTLKFALSTLGEIRQGITEYEKDPSNSTQGHAIRKKLDTLNTARLKNTFTFNTPFYADAMLFDLLNVYAQKYVLIRWYEDTSTRQLYGRATIDLPALDNGIPLDVKGMDGRELAYERLGSDSQFSLLLRKSGRLAVDSFRDLVKVWHARIEANTSGGIKTEELVESVVNRIAS